MAAAEIYCTERDEQVMASKGWGCAAFPLPLRTGARARLQGRLLYVLDLCGFASHPRPTAEIVLLAVGAGGLGVWGVRCWGWSRARDMRGGRRLP